MYYEDFDLYLEHYGMPRRSGRYPYGSGENPYQHAGDFLSSINKYKADGLSDTEIARAMGLSTTQYRIQRSLANSEQRLLDVARAKSLKEDGLNNTEIGRKMGINESSVRSLLDSSSEARMNASQNTADILKKFVDENGMVDVGAGVEQELGVSRQTLDNALYILEMEGYEKYGGGMNQVTNPGKRTNMQVLCPPGTEHKDIYKYDEISGIRVLDDGKVSTLKEYHSTDSGKTFEKWHYPESIDSKRIEICYGDQGGKEKDGVIELRRGVEDISLGDSQYAQVRIAVDGTHYLKGMAMYTNDLPDGIDIRFNTNKPSGTDKKDVFKEMKLEDPDNPFGANIKDVSAGGQRWYEDPVTGKKKLSVINKVRDEGDWDKYSDSLSSQFLAKQKIELIDKQLKLTYANSEAEFDEIKNLTNPTIKKKMLATFADECDGASVHLKAAALPRQSWQVILPVTSLKDNEIYAPNYKDGETVALIRYPHGGTFEIPILKVNNKQADAKSRLGNVKDAVGINSSVAERLSGADFDGDTVLVIPMSRNVRITSTKPLKGLEGFDPKIQYSTEGKTGVSLMAKGQQTQTEMGKISNLITDMTLKDATPDELARAVRHSMVVIDAAKHKLDYKQSYEDNAIGSLKKKYQGTIDSDGNYHDGAATLMSMAKGKATVPERKGSPQWDRETGEVYYKESGRTYEKKTPTGTKTVAAVTETTKMAVAKDAHTLSSGTPKEEIYAEYANKMKALANTARLEYMRTGNLRYSPEAKRKYATEVDSLDAKLSIAERNAPKEREAQRIANVRSTAKKQDNPEMSNGEYKKIRQRELSAARIMVGAKKESVKITDKEWEAIQAGAISENKLTRILNNADLETVKKLATPKATNRTLTNAQISRIKAMSASGYSTAAIAEAVGISASTVHNYVS